jgi:hypothetical protein
VANFKINTEIVDIIYAQLASISVPKYKLLKPTGITPPPAEYIVINSLPVPADVMQKVYVNVNYHVKDLASGLPDKVKLAAGSIAVLDILQKVSTTAYLIDFEGQATYQEQGQSEHFSNLRFSIKYINN